MKRTINKLTGFTLIELLIVVAIIAILAAIAVPNFLEAQTRAKVSRVRADHRSIATAMEMYHIDTNLYPLCTGDNWCLAYAPGRNTNGGNTLTLERLTTPISYMSGKAGFSDPFKAKSYWEGPTLQTKTPLQDRDNKQLYWYTARNAKDSAVWWQPEAIQGVKASWWFLQSAGPDLAYDWGWKMINGMTLDSAFNRAKCGTMIYDASNGTISRGSVWRVGGEQVGTAKSFYHMIATSYN